MSKKETVKKLQEVIQNFPGMTMSVESIVTLLENTEAEEVKLKGISADDLSDFADSILDLVESNLTEMLTNVRFTINDGETVELEDVSLNQDYISREISSLVKNTYSDFVEVSQAEEESENS
jgi:hypothetical protein